MYVFDFDRTLATTEARTFQDFRAPEFVDNAKAMPLTDFAAHVSKRARTIILTARNTDGEIGAAIERYCARHGIRAEVVGVGGMFENVRVPGARKPRKPNTAEKKALYLSGLSGKINFYDDDAKNIEAARALKNVTAHKVG